MSRTGKCTNYANCILAYRGEPVTPLNDEFVCPECGKPLAMEGAGRKSRIPIIIVGLTLLALVAIAAFALIQLRRIGPLEKAAAPAETEMAPPAVTEMAPPAQAEKALPAGSEMAPPAEVIGAAPIDTPGIEVRRAEPVEPDRSRPEPPAPPASAASPGPSVPANLNLDVQTEQNRQVKKEVLKRIDLMPTISPENKDRLYFSVERARQMGKIITIPFAFGQRQLSAGDIGAIKSAMAAERVRKVLEDPTAVLVVLGFADTKGDEQKNLKISADRADEVLRAMRDKLALQNVMHAVGMGGSTLFDETGLEKNRVVEVWVVLP